MDKTSTFYPALEFNSRSTDSIFRELCRPADDKKLGEDGWKETFVRRYGEMMAAAPNERKLAARLINEGLAAKGYAAVDVEHCYFVTFTDGYKNPGDTAYRHNRSHLKEAYSLVEAAIFNIYTHDWWNTWNELGNDRTNGIYSEGAGAEEWGPDNKLPFSSKVIADILYYDKSVSGSYPGEVAKFWNKYSALYRDFLADSFLGSALLQYQGRLLTDQALNTLLDFYNGKAPAGSKVIKLDVYGYYASDILCICLEDGRVFLYIPGANMPFREFLTLREMKSWIVEQLRWPESCHALARHFSLYDRQDGASYYGVDSVLRFMAQGKSEWDPQRFIIYSQQTYDLKQDLFAAMRQQIKARTEADKEMNPMAIPDYMLSFGYFFMAQAQMVRMVLPEAPVMFDTHAAHTPLGLSSAWVVDTQRMKEPHQNWGSRLDSDTFRALELLRVATLMAEGLKSYSRPAGHILPFVTEQDAIFARFALIPRGQAELRPGDEPVPPLAGEPDDIRLVRLAGDAEPLAVVSHYAANQYRLLDTLTLKPVDGQMVSAVVDEATGKTVYTANRSFCGYLSYQPYRIRLEQVWTPVRYRENLGTLDETLPAVVGKVYDLLERIHTSVSLGLMEEAALELIGLVNAYAAIDGLPYRETLATVAMQVEQTFFPDGMENLRASLVPELPVIGTQAATYVYEAGLDEMTGRNRGLAATLLRYARRDNIVSQRSSGRVGQLSPYLAYPPLFVVHNLADFNALSTRYFEQEPYKSQGLTDNKSVLIAALSAIYGLIPSCFVREDKLYIGCTYEEIVHTVSEGSCHADSFYTAHPLTVLRMLQDVSGNADDPAAGLAARYGLPAYFRLMTERRMKTMRDVYHLTENFDFSAWDADYGESFVHEFEAKEGETPQQTVQRQIGMLLGGKGCALPATAAGVNFFLDHLQEFIAAGVTCIGVTSLYDDIIRSEIERYLADKSWNPRLDAVLLTLDEGQAEGPFRRLLSAAHSESLSLLPLGHADGSVAEAANGFTHLYFRGGTLLNALRSLPRTGKVVVFTHRFMMFSTPGLNAPLPGLTQCLHIPGVWVDAEGQLHPYTDSPVRSILVESEECKEVDGEIVPVINEEDDAAAALLRLVPDPCKLLGLAGFSFPDMNYPSPATRDALLKKTVSEADWPALKQEVDAIKAGLAEWATKASVTGSELSLEVNRQLDILGYRPGNGVTLAWWICEWGNTFHTPLLHAASTVLIGGNEYVVDVSHQQYGHRDENDDAVLLLPVDDWADEMCKRVLAFHPTLVYGIKTQADVERLSPFAFIEPPRFA